MGELRSRYQALLDAVEKEPEEFREMDFQAIEDGMMAFANYVNSIYAMEILLPLQKFRLEGDELRDYTVQLDRARKTAHNSAIASANLLFRLAGNLGVQPMTDGIIDLDNPSDRRKAANFCAKLVMDIIYDEVKIGIDDTVSYMAEHRMSLSGKRT